MIRVWVVSEGGAPMGVYATAKDARAWVENRVSRAFGVHKLHPPHDSERRYCRVVELDGVGLVEVGAERFEVEP